MHNLSTIMKNSVIKYYVYGLKDIYQKGMMKKNE